MNDKIEKAIGDAMRTYVADGVEIGLDVVNELTAELDELYRHPTRATLLAGIRIVLDRARQRAEDLRAEYGLGPSNRP